MTESDFRPTRLLLELRPGLGISSRLDRRYRTVAATDEGGPTSTGETPTEPWK